MSETYTPLWRYDAPAVFSVTPEEVPPQGNATLTIVGANFGWLGELGDGGVRVGGRWCPAVSWSDAVVLCVAPVGVAAAAVVSVRASGQVSLQPGAGDVVFLRYAPPVIDTVQPLVLPTVGGVVMTITGDNFGTPLPVSVWLALVGRPTDRTWTSSPARVLPCNLVTVNCTSRNLECVAPPGYGLGWRVVVVNHNDSLSSFDVIQYGNSTNVTVSYMPPVIDSVSVPVGTERRGVCRWSAACRCSARMCTCLPGVNGRLVVTCGLLFVADSRRRFSRHHSRLELVTVQHRVHWG